MNQKDYIIHLAELREEIAIRVLQSIAPTYMEMQTVPEEVDDLCNRAANWAVRFADALIVQLEKQK